MLALSSTVRKLAHFGPLKKQNAGAKSTSHRRPDPSQKNSHITISPVRIWCQRKSTRGIDSYAFELMFAPPVGDFRSRVGEPDSLSAKGLSKNNCGTKGNSVSEATNTNQSGMNTPVHRFIAAPIRMMPLFSSDDARHRRLLSKITARRVTAR